VVSAGASTTDADRLHAESIVIDGTCPLAGTFGFLDWYREGGVTAAVATAGGVWPHLGAGETLKGLGSWLRMLRSRHDLVLVEQASDIEAAKRARRMGVVLHFQGTDAFEASLDLVGAYQKLGVRMVQLTYNLTNRVGDGCEERTDSGLSRFGIDLVRQLNEHRIVVDCSHTGFRTTMDAFEVSNAPTVFSHANVRGVHDCPRNITDEQIKAAAATGGLIGINGFPYFVDATGRPTLDAYIAHIEYVAELVGIDHVAVSMDYYQGMAAAASAGEAETYHARSLASGRWSPESYPPPPHRYPEGLGDPREMPNLTRRLLERGYSTDDVKKIIGGNWMRIFREVWGGRAGAMTC
jgi:membrane dipeptidase